MFRAWMALAAIAFGGVASGQGPSYSVANIVNASDYSAGPFAPNSVLTLFGANLAFSTAGLTRAKHRQPTLPIQLARRQRLH